MLLPFEKPRSWIIFSYHCIGPIVISKYRELIAKGDNDGHSFLSTLQPNGRRNEVVLSIAFHSGAGGNIDEITWVQSQRKYKTEQENEANVEVPHGALAPSPYLIC